MSKKKVRYVDQATGEIKETFIEIEDVEDNTSLQEDTETLFSEAITCKTNILTELYENYKKAEQEFLEVYEPVKANLLKLYETHKDMDLPGNVILGDKLKLTHVKESVRTSIDSVKLKAELPDIAKKYSKETTVKPSMRLTEIKGE